MTALCGGGASSPKPGFAETIIFTAGELATLLESSGNVWLEIAAPILGVISYDAINLCTTDPPAYPTFTAAEANALLQLQFGTVFDSALAKFKDLVLNVIWNTVCQCNSPPQPKPLQPVPPPTGFGIFNPGNACKTDTTWQTPTTFSSDGQGNITFGQVATNGSTCTISGSCSPAGGGGFPITWSNISLRTSTGAVVDPTKVYTITFPLNGSFAFTFPIPQTGTVTQLQGHRDSFDSGGELETVSFIVTTDCGSAGVDCCPPDPAVAQLLKVVSDMVTLIQRQAVPFAYVPGTTHSALSGTGELTVSGLIGAKINPTSIPAWHGVVNGDPDELWLDSWITWGNADGWTHREMLTHAPYVSLPSLAGQFTKIGYTFAGGLVCDVTELLREP